ncbi:hypothetical protein Agub_g6695, partial [Astrephomene gubernaculifera]
PHPPPPSALNLHLSSFLAACQRHLPLLKPLTAASGAPLESRLLLLRVLRVLLRLDAGGLLQPGAALDFALNSYCGLLDTGAKPGYRGTWTPALQLLPTLAAHLPPGEPLNRLFGPAPPLPAAASIPGTPAASAAAAAATTAAAPMQPQSAGAVTLLVPCVCPSNSRRDHPDPSAPAALDMSMRLHALMLTLVQLSYTAAAASTAIAAVAASSTTTDSAGAGDRAAAAVQSVLTGHAAAASSLLESLLIVVQDMGGPMGHLLQTKLVRMFARVAAAAWNGTDAAVAATSTTAAADGAGTGPMHAASITSHWPGAT